MVKKILLLIACLATNFLRAQTKTDGLYQEQYRPQFHFSPARNWTNDPNGLVYFKGQYHLFYQYNPLGNRWGHMSWGHAVSEDLVHWKQLPVALREENRVMIFSGSCVVDENNSSGFGRDKSQTPMVAVYTGFFTPDSSHPDITRQAQCIAYSLDNGTSWTKWKGNPVLDLHKKDFRDPGVFWYAPTGHWVMAVVLPDKHIVQFYTSRDLKSWMHRSDFGPAGDTSDVWECPSLARLDLQGEPGKTKWVLLVSVQQTMQYFVGDFDGTRFTSKNPADSIYRPDWGPDFYAGIVFNHLPPGKPPILLGWVNNWKYANDIPVSPWKGAMSLPRQLTLVNAGKAWHLLERPTSMLKNLRMAKWTADHLVVTRRRVIPFPGQQLEIEVDWSPASHSVSGINIACDSDHYFKIGYDRDHQDLFIDRSRAGDEEFNKSFASLSHYHATLGLQHQKLHLHIFFDNSIVEVFANDGRRVLTGQLFPAPQAAGIQLFSNQVLNTFDHLSIWRLKSAW